MDSGQGLRSALRRAHQEHSDDVGDAVDTYLLVNDRTGAVCSPAPSLLPASGSARPAGKASPKKRGRPPKTFPAMSVLDNALKPDDIGEHHFREHSDATCEHQAATMVAQLVNDKEVLDSKEVRDACDKEWNNLLSRNCWDIKKAEKWSVVKAQAKGETIHLGSLCELCYLEGSDQ